MTKELQTQKENSGLLEITDPALLAKMEADAKNYVDETKTEDMALPRIKLLQPSSPEILKNKEEYVAGAEMGDFINTVTSTLIKGDEGFNFVPVKRRIVYLEWKDRNKGGGMTNNYGEDATAYNAAPLNDKKGRIGTEPDTEIVKTYEVYGYVVNIKDGSYSEALLNFSKTAVKKMKKWNTIMRGLRDKTGNQLPEYATVYKIVSVPETNGQGQSYHNYEVSALGYTLAIPVNGSLIYDKAKVFAENIKNADISANYEAEKAKENNPNSELI